MEPKDYVPPAPGTAIQPTSSPLSSQPAAPTGPDYNTGKKRKLLVFLVVTLVVLAGAGTYVVAYYVPNKPANVWKTGFSRSGQLVDGAVAMLSDEATKQAYKSMEVNGSLTANSGEISTTGTIAGKYDEKTTDSAISLSYSDETDQQVKLGLDWRSQLADGQTYPDSYFRLSGLKSLGLDALIPGIEQYDSQWISLSSDYLKQLLPVTDESDKAAAEQLTEDDVVAAVKVAANVTKSYVFTNDPAKAVILQKQFVAKEPSEGVAAYHYKAAIHKDNARAYCVALGNAMLETQAYKKLTADDGQTTTEAKESIDTSCDDSTKEIKDSETFDIWITAGQKIIQKVRVTDPEKAGDYVEFGHTFDGGDTVPQFFRLKSESDKVAVEQRATYDMKTKKLSLVAEGRGEKTEDMDAFDFKLRLSLAPYDGEVPFEKPANSVPFEDVLKFFGIDASVLADPTLYDGVEASAPAEEA